MKSVSFPARMAQAMLRQAHLMRAVALQQTRSARITDAAQKLPQSEVL